MVLKFEVIVPNIRPAGARAIIRDSYLFNQFILA